MQWNARWNSAVYGLLALVVFIAVIRGAKEGFSANKNVCDLVKKGAYPQISLDNVLDKRMCKEIIKTAERFARDNDGWKTDRHEAYPTTDFDTADIPTLKFPIENIVYRKIVPKMAKAYNLDPLKLGISEVFVAKYDADKGQKSLGRHVDGSDFSFVIALNDGFEGGGTKFAGGSVKKPGVGSAVGFCGRTKHQGLKVTRGTRYILAGFMTYETPEGCGDDSDSDDD